MVRQLLRYHRDESGRIVKKDDHGPDALLCAMLPFPFIDEFDTAISQLLSGNDRERLKVTDKLLDACVRDYEQVPDRYNGSSMGVSVGASGFYVMISTLSDAAPSLRIRKALFIGRVKTFDDLDVLMRQFCVLACVISMQPEPHLVRAWSPQSHYGNVYMVHLLNDGLSQPAWPQWAGIVTVDRTFLLNSAYEEIREQRLWLPRYAGCIDGGSSMRS